MTTLLHPFLWPVLLLLASSATPPGEEIPAPAMPDLSNVPLVTVLGVDEANQITVQQQSGTSLQVRLAYVQDPADTTARQAARIFLHNLLVGEKVWLVYTGPSANPKDHRCYVYRSPDKLFVNLETVRQGYADMVPEPTGSPITAKAIHYWREQARHKNKGVWAMAPATSPAATQPTGKTVATATASQPEAAIVYVSTVGKKYHRANCRSLRKAGTPITLDEARKIYEPCKQCNPPQ